ncbi:MAG TPA: hypothetical protein P5551_04160 [Syntrophales bacterium]|jgi:hypothetical protein|nr:hypothetical protein [Syntrophales bacterium]HRT61541.1 hypothetical protein [Syntrophales bacterium]
MMAQNEERNCESCGYYSPCPPHVPGKCYRFARFLEHVINEYTRDCDYWSPQGGEKPSAKSRRRSR